MPSTSRPLGRPFRDQIVFSIAAVLVMVLALRLLGVRSPISSVVLSILLTVALNAGLAAWGRHRERRIREDQRIARRRDGLRHPTRSGGGDIRWRDEER